MSFAGIAVLVPLAAAITFAVAGAKIRVGQIFRIKETGGIFVILEDKLKHRVSFENLEAQGIKVDTSGIRQVSIDDLGVDIGTGGIVSVGIV